ncbi:hypothetical protein DVH05_027545 [Phytophthora capsici]|nr:hypothetical protein DVH05_027545 [Phytophthora capsici]
MNLQFSEFVLERSENDDDIDNISAIGKTDTPSFVRDAATSSVSRWHWKFWKKTAPIPLKQHHKRPLSGGMLAPLPEPGRNLQHLDHYINDIAERHFLPPSVEKIVSNSIGPLPPIEMQILQRPRLCLDMNGSPTVAMEHLVRLQECKKPKSPVNILQLARMPKKCVNGDEIALMPCHSLQYRGYELLSAELWREPVRDRYKNWLLDEIPFLTSGSLRRSHWSMTRAPGPTNRGKWTRYSKLHRSISVSPVKKPQRVLLRSQGVLLSRSYCVVSVYGEGINGRLYGAGLTDKKRFLWVEAYEPATSKSYFLRVTLQDIEWIFRVGQGDHQRQALLAAGRKQELLHQLIGLLYFEYPEDDVEKVIKTKVQTLKISPQIQLNESASRRLERQEQLRQEEARRLEDLAALLGKPRRARHRLLCQTLKLRGRTFYVSIYHFPAQARNLVVAAYNPSSSLTYRLTIGLLEAASLVKLCPYPRSGFSAEQTLFVARGLIQRLQIFGREGDRPNTRMMLAIDGGRKGPGMEALPLLAPMMTEELKREEMRNKMLRDSRRSVQLELEMTQLRLHNDAETERAEIRQKIVHFEAKRAEIKEKDQAHKTRIEEIDGVVGGAKEDVKRLHEERRALKTARQALKTDLKAAATQIAELKKNLQTVSDKEKTSGERAQRRAEKARKRISDEVLQETVPVKKQLPIRQRTWLARGHIQPGRTLLASGGCRMSGKRVRYSLFALGSEADVDLDAMFSLELYDPADCSQCSSFTLSKLEWLAFTKNCHEQQQCVPELAPPTSEVIKRLGELRERMKESREALTGVSTGVLKGKKTKTNASNTKKKREELRRVIAEASHEIHRLNREAPWPVLIKSLCERCSIVSKTDSEFAVALDRCIFRSVSPILRMTNDENEDNEAESSAVYCRVRVEVLPLAKAVAFDVWDPYEGQQWRIEYTESRELLHEFVVETFIEQQMHLEAIVMSLMLHVNAETGRLELRFEE